MDRFSVWIANASYPKYCSSCGINFQGFRWDPMDTFVKIRNKIKRNAKSSVLKKMYAVVGMGETSGILTDIIGSMFQ